MMEKSAHAGDGGGSEAPEAANTSPSQTGNISGRRGRTWP